MIDLLYSSMKMETLLLDLDFFSGCCWIWSCRKMMPLGDPGGLDRRFRLPTIDFALANLGKMKLSSESMAAVGDEFEGMLLSPDDGEALLSPLITPAAIGISPKNGDNSADYGGVDRISRYGFPLSIGLHAISGMG
ncbi:hypothetical protein ACLOJK_030057 [Asimina triloba]